MSRTASKWLGNAFKLKNVQIVQAKPRACGPTYMRGRPEYAARIKCAGRCVGLMRAGLARIATPNI